jgi:uncharacterized membrane protein
MTELTRLAPLVFGLLMIVTGALGMAGRLPRNDWVGLRLHAVMVSDRTWRVGHKAGGPWLLAGGCAAAGGGAALLITYREPGTGLTQAFALLAIAVAGYALGAWRAQAAVRRLG